mgnify:CR=1 FL=1
MRRTNAKALLELTGGKALIIPKEGWTGQTFRKNGLPMIRAMYRISQIVRRQAQADVARRAAQVFDLQLEELIRRFLVLDRGFSRRSVKAGSDLEIFLETDKNLFLDLINQVLKDTGSKTRAKIIGPVRSVMDQGYAKTSMLMGQVAKEGNSALAARALNLADKITDISERTRGQFRRILTEAVDEKLSVASTVRRLRKEMPKLNGQRALVIARTELNRGWYEGAVQSFKESSTLTHVSIIGCESIEQERWDQPSFQQYMWNGKGTCNAEDVPVQELDKLNFHPQHTGSPVPSGFADV